MTSPEAIIKHAKSFVNPDAWMGYTHEELTWWVKLLLKRSGMRPLGDKRDKDLYDASNYLAMLQEYIKGNPDRQLSHIVQERASKWEALKVDIDKALELNQQEKDTATTLESVFVAPKPAAASK